jgi:hypothetical protein
MITTHLRCVIATARLLRWLLRAPSDRTTMRAMTVPAAGIPAGWTALWECARRLAAARGGTPDEVFGPIGLLLENPARASRWEYTTTPIDALTFASTGHNGVHFSLLGHGSGPVVMTAPMSFDSPNRVLGADLPEFLALGCRTGYRRLEALAHGFARRELMDRVTTGVPGMDGAELELLGHLGAEFALQPWPDVAGRLRDLAALAPTR